MVSRDMLAEHYLSNISVGSHISKIYTITTITVIMSTRRTGGGRRGYLLNAGRNHSYNEHRNTEGQVAIHLDRDILTFTRPYPLIVS
jgi:hypothetical protein